MKTKDRNARILRLSQNDDFREEFVEPWQAAAQASLERAVKEARLPAAERNAQAVVDAVREYAHFSALAGQVDGTLELLAERQAKREAKGLEKEVTTVQEPT